jgi:hypothetical protein
VGQKAGLFAHGFELGLGFSSRSDCLFSSFLFSFLNHHPFCQLCQQSLSFGFELGSDASVIIPFPSHAGLDEFREVCLAGSDDDHQVEIFFTKIVQIDI